MATALTRALEAARLRSTLPAAPVRRRIREHAGVPQAAIAGALGVDRATVSRWETGSRMPHGPLLRRYLTLLDRLAAVDEGHGHHAE